MAIKVYKPITPGQRNMTGYSFEEITKKKPERSLIVMRKANLAVTCMVVLPCAIRAVVIGNTSVWLISNVINVNPCQSDSD